MNKTQKQKIFFTSLFALFVLLTFLAPYVVKAQQQVVDPATTAAVVSVKADTTALNTLETNEALQREAEKRAKQVRESISYNLIANGLIPAASMFLNRLAYKVATNLATEGPGGTPLIFTTSWKDYLSYAGGAAIGEFLGQLSRQPWNKLGFNFCNPSLSVKLVLQLAFFHEVEPEPLCQWTDISANYTALYNRFSDDKRGAVLSLVGFQFQRGQSELGISLSAHDTLYQRVWQNDREAEAQRQEGNGFKPVLGGIAGNVRTPASVFENELNEQSRTKNKASDIHVSSFLANSDLYGQFGAVAGAVFINTLAEKLLNKFFEGYLPDIPTPPPYIPQPGLLASAEDQGGAGLISLPEVYGDLLTVQFSPPTNYNPVNEFITCIRPGLRGANHCVMDADFAAAVNSAASGEPLTVRQALAQNLLHANWPLISAQDVAKNSDPLCYTGPNRGGYCESNLKKLRLARIIPVGWELAARRSPVSNPITLGEAVNNFLNCNSGGVPDDTHPYCHLIDPNWVIKLPLTQCRARMPGNTRVSADSPAREEICVDAQTCIEENEKGECVGGYGYCTREKTVWRLRGDHCPAQFASCRTLNPRTGGAAVNYLLGTVDVSVCNESNVGCVAYSTGQNATTALWTPQPTIYLDKDATACEEKDAGCTELISRKAGVALNLISNGSFENDVDNNGQPDGWLLGLASGAYLEDSASDAFSGTDAVRFAGGTVAGLILTSEGVQVLPDTTYTISIYAQLAPGGTLPADEADYPYVDLNFEPGVDVETLPTNCRALFDGGNNSLILPLTAGIGYERFSCSFTTPSGVSAISVPTVAVAVPDAPGGTNSILIDTIQLEEGLAPSSYLDSGQYGEVTNAYLKVSPSYLNCTGEVGESVECRKYARICRVDEIGCELYTPQNGDPAVPGIVGSGDRCPEECVGYDTFKQEASTLDPTERFPLYFIPSTARQCRASVVGCDEFTNLDMAATGGEAREYFTSLRICQKPTTDRRAYYTWEGSDTVGYQLRVWNLKKSNLNNGPCTRLNSANPILCDDVADDNADSIELPTGSPGGCTADEVTTNPDCREFYDSGENIYRRLYMRTIVSTNDCHPYRKTESSRETCEATNGAWNNTAGTCIYNVYPGESGQCVAEQNGCRAFTGDTGRNTFDVMNTNFESGTAEGWTGGTPSSESVNVGGSSLGSEGAVLFYPLTATSTIRQGGTYSLEFWAKGIGSQTVSFLGTAVTPTHYFAGGTGGAPRIDLGVDWKLYSLGPVEVSWIPPPNEGLTIFGHSRIYLDNVVLREVNENIYLIKDSWNTPASCDQTLDGTPLSQAMLGCEEYQDRASASHYLKSFTQLCREESVGCEGFINTQNSAAINAETYNLYCQLGGTGSECADPNGCPCPDSTATLCTVTNTQRSCTYKTNDVGAVGPSAGCGANTVGACRGRGTVTIGVDQNINFVNAPEFACDAVEIGCSALGEHKTNRVCTLGTACPSGQACLCTNNGASCFVGPGERSCVYENPPGSVATKTILNQPDTYNEIMCARNAEGCEQFTYQAGGEQYYFKKPEEQLCEYQDNAVLAPGSPPVSGWFKQGTTDPCGYIDITPQDTNDTRSPYIAAGGSRGIWKNADPNYEGYVGLCPSAQSLCTEFRDEFDTSDRYPDGRPYYYLKNNKINSGNCNGQVNPKEGCVLINDTSNPARLYNTELTYQLAHESGDNKIAPVSCANNPTCAKRCAAGTLFFSFCSSDADCRGSPCRDAPTEFVGVDDANTIVRAKQDRACTDWLACRTSTSVWDQTLGSPRELCVEYGRCLEYSENSSGSVCTRFASAAAQVLTSDRYSNRDITFRGSDYAGYSIPGLYHVAAMSVSSSGSQLDVTPANDEVNLECRGFPESTAPFPTRLAEFDGAGHIISREQGWEAVNICATGNNNDCACSYTKIAYGGSVEYGDSDISDIPIGRCAGGPRDGESCVPGITSRQSTSLSCGPADGGGSCQSLSRLDRLIGYQGFCLERDSSIRINGDQLGGYNCLAWYPSDIVHGRRDIYNYYEKAGFSSVYPGLGARFYCAQAEGKYIEPRPPIEDGGYLEPEICKTIVDLGNPSTKTIYARTDTAANPAYVVDPGSPGSNLNFQYSHDVSPFGSAALRYRTPGQTSDIPWTNYMPGSCRFAPSDQATVRKLCTASAVGSCDEENGCTVEVIKTSTSLVDNDPYNSDPIEVICKEADGCECDSTGYANLRDADGELLDNRRNVDTGCVISYNGTTCTDSEYDNECTLDADYYSSYPCVDDPTAIGDDKYYFQGGTCREENGCEIQGEARADWKCAEENGCDCGYDYLACNMTSGASSCNYSEKLIYGGIPWSCDNFCGVVIDPDGRLNTFDFDPATSTLRNPSSSDALNSAVTQLQTLFGKNDRVYNWNGDGYTRVDCEGSPLPAGCWDEITDSNNRGIEDLPQLSAIKSDGTLVRTGLGALPQSENAFSVNGRWQSGVEVGGTGGSFNADLQFAYWTESHGPITGIRINWDDGTEFKTTDSKYKNHIPNCGQGLAGANNFVTSSDACEPSPALFKHTYLYSSSCVGQHDVQTSHSHLDLGITLGMPHCHFIPRVTVIDNWGYCNGECGPWNDGLVACLDDKDLISSTEADRGLFIDGECTVVGGRGNTLFKGSIIVAP